MISLQWFQCSLIINNQFAICNLNVTILSKDDHEETVTIHLQISFRGLHIYHIYPTQHLRCLKNKNRRMVIMSI